MAYISTSAHAQTFEVSCGAYKELNNRPFIGLRSDVVSVHLSIEEAEDLVADIQDALADSRAMEDAA